MADRITQELGFDATQAIQSINAVIGALGKFNVALTNSAQALRAFNSNKLATNIKNFATNTQSAAKAATNLAKAGKQFADTDNKVQNLTKSSKGLVISFQTLSRIVFAQLIVRGINSIQQAFREALDTARDFGLAVAEAAAIAPGGVENFTENVARLNKELIETSNSFGFDVLDLAEARYQEFSNQVEGSADSNRLFIASNKLARISASDVSEAVGALSSVLNSYGQTVDSADQVSAALFKTIELGRIRLSDIADQLGNVTPLARSAGVGFEELAGALTTITRAGVSPSRSLTQIRALINQLTKPTKALQELFTETFQVANVQEAVQRFGSLQGVIRAIGDQAQGDSARISEFFSNIRARNAFEALNQQLDLFSENVTKIGDAADEGAAFIDRFLAEFNEQDAVQFTIALNQLRNSFLQFAQEALPGVTVILNQLSGVFTNLGGLLNITVAGGLALASKRFITAAASADTFTASVIAFEKALILGAGAIGFAAGELLQYIETARLAANLDPVFAALEDIKVENIKEIEEETGAAIRVIKEFGEETQRSLQILNREAAASRDTLREQNEEFISGIDSSLDTIISSQKRLIKELDNNIKGAQDRITKNQEDQSKIRQKIADVEFENQVQGLNELQQAFAEQERAEDSLARARRTDTGEQGLEQRLAELAVAEKQARDALSTARDTGNLAQIFNTETLLKDILNEQLNTKQAQADLDAQQVALSKQIRAEEQARLDTFEKNAKKLLENLDQFGPDGTLLSPEQRDQSVKNAKEAFDAIRQAAFESGDFDIGQLLGLTDIQRTINETIGRTGFDTANIGQNLQDAIDQAAQGRVAQIPVEFILAGAGDLGLDTANFNALQPLQGLENIRQQAVAQLEENQQAQQRINKARQEEEEIIGRIQGRLQELSSVNREFLDSPLVGSRQEQQILDVAAKIENAFIEISQTEFITTDQINNFRDLIREFDAVGDIPGLPFLGEEDRVIGLVQELQKLQEAQRQSVGNQGELNRLIAEQGELTSLVDSIQLGIQAQELLGEGAKAVNIAVDNTTVSQGQLTSAIDTSTGQVQILTNTYSGLNNQIQGAILRQRELNLAQRNGGINPSANMFGGPVFRAFGGFTPRGTDTIPAMLSPGEVVIKANMARRFASQLNAMNAGVPPVYRQEGGPVINNSVNIGDINVNGTSDPDATARSVVKKLRREFRRGTTSLRLN